MTEHTKREILACCNAIKSAMNSLPFCAPENAHIHYTRIAEAEHEIRRLLFAEK